MRGRLPPTSRSTRTRPSVAARCVGSPVIGDVPEHPLSRRSTVAFGSRCDRPLFGFIAGKRSVATEFTRPVVAVGEEGKLPYAARATKKEAVVRHQTGRYSQSSVFETGHQRDNRSFSTRSGMPS